MLTAERLRSLVSYDPNTGNFTWLASRGGSIAGSVAGPQPRPDGYMVLRIDRTLYFQHRLAWLYVHGSWPEALVDHANGDPSDNRLANLRAATSFQNLANAGVRPSNRSRLKGVSRNPPGWMARIKVDGEVRHLGTFPTPEEAHEAYRAAAAIHHGDFARMK